MEIEIATDENAEIVSRIYSEAMTALHSGKPVIGAQLVIHDVERMMQETNSGVSFEQFFRWASVEQIARTPAALRAVGLEDVAALTEEAMGIAFPNGIPANAAEKSDCTDWSEAQEASLEALFERLEILNGRVMNALGEYAKRERV